MQRRYPWTRPRRAHCSQRKGQARLGRGDSRGAPGGRGPQGTDQRCGEDDRQCEEAHCRHAARKEEAQPVVGIVDGTLVPDHRRCRSLAERSVGLAWKIAQRTRPRWLGQRSTRWPGTRQAIGKFGSGLYHRVTWTWRWQEEVRLFALDSLNVVLVF